MGLTHQTVGGKIWKLDGTDSPIAGSPTIALAGNPNTGKSTVFNALTGLSQHTGNWPGKTVLQARGRYVFRDLTYVLVDLPGTYSLLANSIEEEVARDFLCFEKPDVTVIVTDATCLERNLNLVLQVLEITSKTVVCVNLLDEARRKGIRIDLDRLHQELGVPVVGAVAREGLGLDALKEAIERIVKGAIVPVPKPITYDDDIEKAIGDLIPTISDIYPGRINSRWLALRVLDGDPTILGLLGYGASGSLVEREGIGGENWGAATAIP
jgi:ferrous iron transport protein B